MTLRSGWNLVRSDIRCLGEQYTFPGKVKLRPSQTMAYSVVVLRFLRTRTTELNQTALLCTSTRIAPPTLPRLFPPAGAPRCPHRAPTPWPGCTAKPGDFARRDLVVNAVAWDYTITILCPIGDTQSRARFTELSPSR